MLRLHAPKVSGEFPVRLCDQASPKWRPTARQSARNGPLGLRSGVFHLVMNSQRALGFQHDTIGQFFEHPIDHQQSGTFTG